MRFKRTYDWSTSPKTVAPGDLVEAAIGHTGYDTRGAIETLEAEVRELTKIGGFLVAKLTDADRLELANKVDYERAD